MLRKRRGESMSHLMRRSHPVRRSQIQTLTLVLTRTYKRAEEEARGASESSDEEESDSIRTSAQSHIYKALRKRPGESMSQLTRRRSQIQTLAQAQLYKIAEEVARS
jgi:hypothetical protein